MTPTAPRIRKDLLIVGPLPPPMGGATVTAREMTEELAKDPSLRISIINTSPAGDVRENMAGLNLERLERMIVILARYAWESRHARVVLVFANNLFAATLVPPFLAIARLSHSAFYVKPVGGDLDVYMARRTKIVQWYLRKVFRSADGILAQTRQLQATLSGFGCPNVHYLPGCRSLPPPSAPPDRSPEELHLIFLAHIITEKGPLVLLEALQKLPRDIQSKVRCDFFGPIHHSIHGEFLSQIERTPSARYRGEAPPGSGSRLMLDYDALVLPTFFSCEGHPGVIIEAMHAGIPVVSTRHRSIPELVTSGENGILVPIRDPDALAEALQRMAENPSLRKEMGRANYRRGRDFRTDVVVGQMMKILLGS